MKCAAMGLTHGQQGICVTAGYMVINDMFAAVEQLDQRGKRVYRYPLISLAPAAHPGTEGDAIHFRIIGSGSDGSGFPGQFARVGIAEPEIAKGSAIPEIRLRLMESALIFEARRLQISDALRMSGAAPVMRDRSHHQPAQNPPAQEPPEEITHWLAFPVESGE
jgi:hypothetical protein